MTQPKNIKECPERKQHCWDKGTDHTCSICCFCKELKNQEKLKCCGHPQNCNCDHCELAHKPCDIQPAEPDNEIEARMLAKEKPFDEPANPIAVECPSRKGDRYTIKTISEPGRFTGVFHGCGENMTMKNEKGELVNWTI